MISNVKIVALVLLGAIHFGSSSAYAANYSSITKAELITVFENAGITVSETIYSNILRVSKSNVELAECNAAGRCNEIRFWATYNDVRPTLSAVNEWNYTMKIPEASRTTDGLLHMEMWMTAIGATDTSIVDTLKWFEAYSADESFWGPYLGTPSS